MSGNLVGLGGPGTDRRFQAEVVLATQCPTSLSTFLCHVPPPSHRKTCFPGLTGHVRLGGVHEGLCRMKAAPHSAGCMKGQAVPVSRRSR